MMNDQNDISSLSLYNIKKYFKKFLRKDSLENLDSFQLLKNLTASKTFFNVETVC